MVMLLVTGFCLRDRDSGWSYRCNFQLTCTEGPDTVLGYKIKNSHQPVILYTLFKSEIQISFHPVRYYNPESENVGTVC